MGSRSRGTICYPALRICVHTLYNNKYARVCEVREELLPAIPRTRLSHKSNTVYGCATRGYEGVSDTRAFFRLNNFGFLEEKKRLARICVISKVTTARSSHPFIGEKYHKVTPIRLRFAKDIDANCKKKTWLIAESRSVRVSIYLTCDSKVLFYRLLIIHDESLLIRY